MQEGPAVLLAVAALNPAVLLQRQRTSEVVATHVQPRLHWPRTVQLVVAHDVGNGETDGEGLGDGLGEGLGETLL
jgi:hypothetical protein